GRPAPTTSRWPSRSSTAAPTWRSRAAPSALPWTTPSATAAGTSPGCLSRAGHRWTPSGTLRPWGCSPGSTNSSAPSPRPPRPLPRADLTEAFGRACHGGQRRAADRLLAAGADITACPAYANNQSALDAAIRPDTRRDLLASWLQERRGPVPPNEATGSRE